MKTRLTVTNEEYQDTIIRMREMEPWQVCCIIENGHNHSDYVMRTADSGKFEVVNLTTHRADGCWTMPNDLRVRLLRPNEKVTLTFIGEE